MRTKFLGDLLIDDVLSFISGCQRVDIAFWSLIVSQDQVFTDWKEREAIAEAMVPLVGGLYRDRNIECSVFGRLIIKRSVVDISEAHRYVRQVEEQELTVSDTLPLLEGCK